MSRALTLRSLATLALIAILVSIFAVPSSDAQRRVVPASREGVQQSFAPVVKQAAPAVVNVYVRSRVQAFSSPFANDPVFRRFFGDRFGVPQERQQNSLGSGVIVASNGVVVTNTHVIRGGGSPEIRVVLADKREYDAQVLVQDEKTDIAVLRIEGLDQPLPFLEFADSDTAEVGDLVLAIGNPFGVGQTVTSGIVSAIARSEVGQAAASVFIQTDAAINPGNSGGALVDMGGRLIGINTAIYSQSGGSHGIGFAIPSNLVRLYVDSALAGRKVEKPWLGARLEAVTRDIADGLGLTRVTGSVVTRVSTGSPAEEAGLRPRDVIIAVDGFESPDPRSVTYRLTTRGVGNRVKLDVVRNGRALQVDLRLRAAPEPGRGDVRNLSGQHPLDGARVATLLPSIADELGIDEEEGVVVTGVRPNTIAAGLGFKPGDVILKIGDIAIATVADLERAVAQRQRVWTITVKRADKVVQLQVPG